MFDHASASGGDLFVARILAGRASPAGASCFKFGGYGKPRTHGRADKVDTDGAGLLKEIFVDQKGNAVAFHNLVIVFRLIQSHAQRGPGSAPLGQKDPDRLYFVLSLKKLLNHFVGLFRHLKHGNLLKTHSVFGTLMYSSNVNCQSTAGGNRSAKARRHLNSAGSRGKPLG